MLKWKNDVRLVTSRFFIYDVMRVSFLSYILMNLVLFITALIVDGLKSYDINFLLFTGITVAGLAVAILLVAILFFGNKIPYEFSVNDQAAGMNMLSRKAKVANRMSFFLGLFSGKPGLAGAGAIATSREYTGIRWKDTFSAKYYPHAGIITLMNNWRAVIRLHCTEDNYAEVSGFVKARIAESNALRAKKAAKRGKEEKISLLRDFPPAKARSLILVTLAAFFLLISPLKVPGWMVLTIWISGIWMIQGPSPRTFSALITIFGFMAALTLQIQAGLKTRNVFDNLKNHPEYRPTHAEYSVFSGFDTADWVLFILMTVFAATAVFMAVQRLRKKPSNETNAGGSAHHQIRP